MFKFLKSNVFIKIIVCILISAILELTLFNFRFYQSKNYAPLLGLSYTVSENLIYKDTNTYELVSNDTPTYIDVMIPNTIIKNIYMDIWPNADVFNCDRLKTHFYVIDEGNTTGYDMPNNDYLRCIWQTMYTFVDMSGKCQFLRISIDKGLDEGELIRIENLGINVPQPFNFSKKRVLFLSFFLILLYFLRPSSMVYKEKTTGAFRYKWIIIFFAVIFQSLIMWKISHLNQSCINPPYESQHQYEMMAESLVEGKVYLNKEPPQSIKDMRNPYSFQARKENGVQNEILYDVAYYNGKYYVYFGVGPIILFYIPYFLVTGSHIPVHILMWFLGTLVSIGWLFLLYQIIKKYFYDFPFALYLVCSALFTTGCGLTFVISRPDFYAVPMTTALVATLFGLGCWVKATLNPNKNIYVTNAMIFIGSFLMAFVAACRPQLLLGSFLIIPLFYGYYIRDKNILKKHGIINSISFIIPYALIASGLMYYNYIRFGSVFDFGANYNLTFNDMTYRGFRINRLLYATIGFMFIPAKVSNIFPYFWPAEYITRYQGYTSDEALLGGLFYNHLYLLSIVLIPKFKRIFKDFSSLIIAIISPLFAIIIMIVDANMAGVLNRYYIDFSWLIIISFFLLFGYVITHAYFSQNRKIIGYIFYFLSILSMIHMLFMVYGGDVNGLVNNNIVAFQKMQHLIEFWN